ncbi:fructose 1,6-bisphosphatase [Microbacterium dextranolyticum]|nr:fructose 1,6-bisphosphatase [Microbacterium dextranolyticum]MBM7462064.1 hypothetical protein [Microbacterium dextranolyticum]
MPPAPLTVRAAAVAATGVLVVTSFTGCSDIANAFNGLQQNAVSTPAPGPSASTAAMPFDSKFTYDGSVSLSSDVAEGLEVRLDVWAADPKRTLEWTPQNDKTFGFAVNVYDHRVDEKAVLTQKRRVYLSMVSITSQVSQSTIGAPQQPTMSPFQFSADPRTLVPTDTLRSDRGLLLNSYQGGLLVPQTTIHQLPGDTYGITLQFALQIWVEGTANTDSSFAQQTVYEVLPIAISDPTVSAR